MKKLLSIAILAALAASLSLSYATPISGSSVTVSSATPGTTAAKLGKAEDAAHASGDTGVAILGRRIDTQAASSGTSGDYETLNMNALGAVYTQVTGNTTGGLSIFRSIDLDETEEEAKGSTGTLYFLDIYNNDAAAEMFIKVYDATAANVTVGTTTPVLTIPCAASTHCQVQVAAGLAFANAITLAATGAIADNDTTAPDANDVVVNVGYK
jgi:hypothetical protein